MIPLFLSFLHVCSFIHNLEQESDSSEYSFAGVQVLVCDPCSGRCTHAISHHVYSENAHTHVHVHVSAYGHAYGSTYACARTHKHEHMHGYGHMHGHTSRQSSILRPDIHVVDVLRTKVYMVSANSI